jgi:hypothetical protein
MSCYAQAVVRILSMVLVGVTALVSVDLAVSFVIFNHILG